MARFDPIKLQSLLEVDRRGSISAAARALHLTPSAVSQHLSALEHAAGTELLQRSVSGSRVTSAGRAMVRHAATIEHALDSIAHDLAAPHARFDLTIGFVPSIAPALAAAVTSYATEWPGCTVHTIETAPEVARRGVLHGDLDAALTIDWPDHPQPRSPELHETILLAEPLLVTHHRDAAASGHGLRQFEHSSWVAASANTGCGATLRVICRRAGFQPDIRHQTNDFNAAVVLAATTRSVAIIPAVLRPPLPRGMTTTTIAGLERHVLLVSRRILAPALTALQAHVGRHLADLASPTSPRRHRLAPTWDDTTRARPPRRAIVNRADRGGRIVSPREVVHDGGDVTAGLDGREHPGQPT
jgi:DNA-binding transcriptional LysR family regulator